MSFVIRSAELKDLEELYLLTSSFVLLNLPADKEIISQKIELSCQSFAGQKTKEEAEYLFVLEDLSLQKIVACSLIIAKHGTKDKPHHYIKVLRQKHSSESLGLSFFHQILQFKLDYNGPTEIGALLLNKNYRNHASKLGKQMSLIRFMFMGMFPEKFENRILCELSPPLDSKGKSWLWNAVGSCFTSLDYQFADRLSIQDDEFISALFPKQDIYLCLLGASARAAVGAVGKATKPAQYFLEKIGFHYLNEIDPFDGAPHYGAELDKIDIFKNVQLNNSYKVVDDYKDFKKYFVASMQGEKFRGLMVDAKINKGILEINKQAFENLVLDKNSKVFSTPLDKFI